jgi:hypothetical protein
MAWFANLKWVIKVSMRGWVVKRKYRTMLSANSKYKNLHAGECCVVIGNGPSLTTADLETLKRKQVVTFAANKIFAVFNETDWRPDYYAVSDDRLYCNFAEQLDDVALPHKFIAVDVFNRCVKKKAGYELFYRLPIIFMEKYRAFRPDMTRRMGEGNTITYYLLQMAAYMGFKEIYLIGCDFSYSYGYDINGKYFEDKSVQDHFKADKTKLDNIPNLRPNLLAYTAARKYGEQHGFHIYNATRGGKLEVFERRDFDKIFNKEEK